MTSQTIPEISQSFCSLIGGPDYKLIYRHYATLYFVFCVDSSESELGILDLIQVHLINGPKGKNCGKMSEFELFHPGFRRDAGQML